MSFALEICHPNEMLSQSWKFVEQIESIDLIDHLHSPSFEVYDGLLVRVLRQMTLDAYYTGAYYNGEFFDIGPGSNVLKSIDFGERVLAKKFMVNKSLDEIWMFSTFGDDMVYGIRDVVPPSFLRDCSFMALNTVLPLAGDQARIVRVAIKATRMLLAGKTSQERWENVISFAKEQSRLAFEVNWQMMYCMEAVINVLYSPFTVFQNAALAYGDSMGGGDANVELYYMDQRLAEFAHEVRKLVPFREVVLGAIKTSLKENR